MKEVTLYIDESGDFETERGEWIVGGVLVRGNPKQSDSTLRRVMKGALSSFGVREPAQLHLTDIIERDGVGRANEVATRALSKVVQEPGLGAELLAVRNGQRRSMQSSERTYRLMLMDLVALSEGVLRGIDDLDRLHLVIASRTIRGERMTTGQDVVRLSEATLQELFENGLASRALVDVVDGEGLKVSLDSAYRRWGLALADVLCNRIFNSRHADAADVLRDAVIRPRLRIFESLGGFEVRRAIVAERDGQQAAALFRWLLVDEPEHRELRKTAIRRILSQVAESDRVRGPLALLESTLDRLHSYARDESPRSIIAALESLDRLAEEVGLDCRLRYRIASFALLHATSAGHRDFARRCEDVLDRLEPEVASDPEYLGVLFDAGANRIERYVQELEFERARESAARYRQQVAKWGECWSLFRDSSEEAFYSSRAWIRATMVWARSEFLVPEHAAAALEVLADLDLSDSPDSDRVRRVSYLVAGNLARGAIEEGVEAAEGFSRESRFQSLWAAFWSLRAANDALLDGLTAPSWCAELVAHWSALTEGERFEGALMARELGLYLALSDDARAAHSWFGRASRFFDALREELPLYDLLSFQVEVLSDYARGREPSAGVRTSAAQKYLLRSGFSLSGGVERRDVSALRKRCVY